jgi:hypothetical protein
MNRVLHTNTFLEKDASPGSDYKILTMKVSYHDKTMDPNVAITLNSLELMLGCFHCYSWTT